MARADFYLIEKPRFREDPLRLVCELVKKAYAAEQPTLVLARSQEQADALDDLLWAFEDESFIPHQLAGDEDDAITAVVIAAPGVETADRPLVVNLRDECAPGTYERVLEVIAADAAERDGSRVRWSEYKRRGFDVAKHDM